MSEGPSSLLTDVQRSVFAGEREASYEAKLRERVRNRVYEGLRTDSKLLFDALQPKDRRMIFRSWEEEWKERNPDPALSKLMWQEKEADGRPLDDITIPDNPAAAERANFRQGITDLLAFLYLGIEEGNLGDFDEVLKSAVEQAARKSNRTLEDFEYHDEFSGNIGLGPQTIAERFRDGDRDLTIAELKLACLKGALDRKEVKSHFEDIDVPDGLSVEFADDNKWE